MVAAVWGELVPPRSLHTQAQTDSNRGHFRRKRGTLSSESPSAKRYEDCSDIRTARATMRQDWQVWEVLSHLFFLGGACKFVSYQCLEHMMTTLCWEHLSCEASGVPGMRMADETHCCRLSCPGDGCNVLKGVLSRAGVTWLPIALS